MPTGDLVPNFHSLNTNSVNMALVRTRPKGSPQESANSSKLCVKRRPKCKRETTRALDKRKLADFKLLSLDGEDEISTKEKTVHSTKQFQLIESHKHPP